MRHLSRSIAVCALCAIMVCSLSLFGCGNLAPSEATKTKTVQAVDDSVLVTPGTLTVGVNFTYAPYFGEDNGEYVGIDVDVASALADELGLKVAFVDTSTIGGSTLLQEGKCDIFLNYDKTASEKETADYLGTYIKDAPSLFTVSVDGTKPTVPTTLVDKTVAVQKDSVSSVAVATLYGSGILDSQDTLKDAFGKVESGADDYVAASGVVGKYIIKSYTDIDWVCTLTATPTEKGIGGDSSNTTLAAAVQDALSTISNNGVLNLVISKWIGSPLDFTTTISSATAVKSTATTTTATATAAPTTTTTTDTSTQATTDDSTDTTATDESTDTTDTGQ